MGAELLNYLQKTKVSKIMCEDKHSINEKRPGPSDAININSIN